MITAYLNNATASIIVSDGIFLVRIVGASFIDQYVHRINRLTAKHPQVGFIIEWLEPSSYGLNCYVVHCRNKLDTKANLNIDEYLEEVKVLITN